MLRRTPLRRGDKPLRRTTRLRARGNTAYRRRERDVEYMRFVKKQPCLLRIGSMQPSAFVAEPGRARLAYDTITPCAGPVEADHAGDRGLGSKADDHTCIPLCAAHHRARTDHTGPFRPLTRDELRAWRAAAIERTQAAWSKHHG